MAKTYFDINKDLKLKGKGSLVALKSIGENALSNNIAKSIQAFQDIDIAYKKAMLNDGKIIGTERTDIIFRVDTLFDMMILIWKNIDNNRGETKIRIENKKKHFLLEIHESNGMWSARGNLTPNMSCAVANFQEIYNKQLAPEIVNLLSVYKDACKDNIIDDDEKESLKKVIKQVLYYILFLRFQLENCLIST